MQQQIAAFVLIVSVSGCGGATQQRSGAPHRAQAVPAPPSAERPGPPAVRAAAPAASVVSAVPGALAELPERVDGGEITRGTLTAVLSSGVGRFLQRVRAEPQLDRGRFLGWRLLSFAEGDATLRSSVLHPGDTVMRVNGQSIERPEQFKNVWDSLTSSSDLVLQVQRAGKQSEVRYRIVD